MLHFHNYSSCYLTIDQIHLDKLLHSYYTFSQAIAMTTGHARNPQIAAHEFNNKNIIQPNTGPLLSIETIWCFEMLDL